MAALTAPAKISFGGALFETLAPLPGYAPGRSPGNNDSLVLRVSFGRTSFLLAGDAERPIENWMLAEGEVARTDVLKVAHHGSRTSSTEPFLDAVRPTFAVISAGFENSYGVPNREVLDRLREPRRDDPPHGPGRSGERYNDGSGCTWRRTAEWPKRRRPDARLLRRVVAPAAPSRLRFSSGWRACRKSTLRSLTM